MKRMISLAVLVFLALSGSGQHLIVGSFNIRFDNPGDSGNLWVNRAPVCASLIRFHQFDILGTQEGLRHQLEKLVELAPEYAYYGAGRDDGSQKGEHSAILYRKDRFILEGKGDFWLSETPDKPSKGWDAALNRVCTWLKLKDRKTGKTLFVFNAHYDHMGVKAREESSKLVLEKVRQIAGRSPAIFMGDLNGNHQSSWYLNVQQSGWMLDVLPRAAVVYRNTGTFNAFKPAAGSPDVIDHIFTTSGFKVKRYGILTDTYNGKAPSDHYPVLAELTF